MGTTHLFPNNRVDALRAHRVTSAINSDTQTPRIVRGERMAACWTDAARRWRSVAGARGRQLLNDTLWTGFGQLAAAIGALVGVRALTQLVSPEIFGAASLWLGVVGLALGVGIGPLAQGVLFLFARHRDAGNINVLRGALFRCSAIAAAGCLVTFCAVAATFARHSPLLLAVVALLFVVDVCRAIALAWLNAARSHRHFALWYAADAWLRPALACAAVLYFPASATLILAANFVAALCLLALFTRQARPAHDAPSTTGAVRSVQRALWRYAAPLIPLGILGWVSGMGDRYLIGGLLSLADAGLYAAAYGLASRPFLMVGGTIELILRPAYQAAVSSGAHARAAVLMRWWLAALVSGNALLLAVIFVWRVPLAQLLLGPQFRAATAFIPWIASGAALLGIAYLFERVCYAYGKSHFPLVIQSISAMVAAAAVTIGALRWGLLGAAAAAPVYYGVQCACAFVAAHMAIVQVREARQ